MKSDAAKAREVAQNIKAVLDARTPLYYTPSERWDDIEKELAATIEAERKAGREEVLEQCQRQLADMRGKCYSKAAEQDIQQARQAALEDCAKLLESEIVAGASEVYIMNMRTLADRIRRLGEKP